MSDFNKLINSYKIVILYFYSDECIKTNSLISKIQKNIGTKDILIQKYNVNNFNSKLLINNLNVSCYPSFQIYKDGKFLDQIIGVLDNIEVIINLYINS
jgi:thiol-disulfide isomerase/thioredoxin